MMKKNRLMLGVGVTVFLLLSTLLSHAVTITVWSRNPFMDQMIKDFNQKMEQEGKDIEAEFTVMPGQMGMIEKLCISLAAGTAPDVVSLDLILSPYFNSIGAFVDLAEQAKRLPYFDDLVWRMGELGRWSGREGKHIYMLPFWSDNSALFYNKDFFDLAGIGYPDLSWTWKEMQDAAIKFTKDLDGDGKPDQFGLPYAGASAGAHMFLFMPFVWSNGGRFLTEDGKSPAIDSPEAIEALQFFRDLALKYKVFPPGVANTEWADMEATFVAEKAGMYLSGNWNVKGFKTDYEMNYGVTLIPKAPGPGKQHSSFIGGDLVGITSQTKHPEEAWEFVEYCLSEDVQVEILASHGMIPIRKNLWENKYFKDEPNYLIFTKTLEVGYSPYTTKYNELYDPMLWAMQKTLLGQISPEEAFKEAAQRMNEILRED